MLGDRDTRDEIERERRHSVYKQASQRSEWHKARTHWQSGRQERRRQREAEARREREGEEEGLKLKRGERKKVSAAFVQADPAR